MNWVEEQAINNANEDEFFETLRELEARKIISKTE